MVAPERTLKKSQPFFRGGHLVKALRYKLEGRAGLTPDGVIGTFHGRNPSGRSMALRLTQPLTEMSTRNISCGVKVAGA